MDLTLSIALVKNGTFDVVTPDGRQRSYTKIALAQWLREIAERAVEGSNLQIKLPHGSTAHPEELQLWKELQDDGQWKTL